MIFFTQIMKQNVSQGDDPSELLALAYRQVAETVAPHQDHAGFKALVRTDGERVIGHDRFNSGGARIASFNHYTFHQVALGKNADQKTLAKDRHGTDVTVNHRLRNIEHHLMGIRSVRILRVN
jgi:hypothetical protein